MSGAGHARCAALAALAVRPSARLSTSKPAALAGLRIAQGDLGGDCGSKGATLRLYCVPSRKKIEIWHP